MKFLIRHWKVTLPILLLLIAARYSWVQIHYVRPLAAYYALATALETNEVETIRRISPQLSIKEWQEIAKPVGGTRTLGKLMLESPKVSAVIHIPFASVDVFSQIAGNWFMIQFVEPGGRCEVSVTSFRAAL